MVALDSTRLRRVLALVVLLGVLVVLMPVVLAWPQVVDGWTIGEPFTCTEGDPNQPCSALLPVAQEALDHRNPAHAAVVSAALYLELGVVRSEPVKVAVFHLADGSVQAIGVRYLVGSTTPSTYDYGPWH